MNTLIVNFLSGPGAGKSTMCGGLFKKLKSNNYNVEYIQEFAKTLTWEKNFLALSNQMYVSGVQSYTQNMLLGQVQAVLTDSPLLLGIMYYKEENKVIRDAFRTFLIETFKAQNNITFFIDRTHPYVPIGRLSDVEKAREIDNQIRYVLDFNKIPYEIVLSEDESLEYCYKKIIERIKND
jgi:hypothetical protein